MLIFVGNKKTWVIYLWHVLWFFFSEIVGLEFYLNVLLNLDLNEMITLRLLIWLAKWNFKVLQYLPDFYLREWKLT